MRRNAIIGGVAAAVVVLAVLIGVVISHTEPEGVEIENARTRSTPAVVTTGVVYLDIKARQGDQLMGVVPPEAIADRATLHEEMAGMNDTMTMAALPSLDIPTGTTRFSPGGKHIMLEELKAPLTAGQTFTIRLVFRDQGVKEVPVRVADRV